MVVIDDVTTHNNITEQKNILLTMSRRNANHLWPLRKRNQAADELKRSSTYRIVLSKM